MINSSAYPYYLDFPYGWSSLKMAYEFKPELPDGEIIGIETALWTEYVPTRAKSDYCVFPRLAAISEIAWSAFEDRNYDRFLNALPKYLDYLNVYNIRFATLDQSNPSKIRGKLQSVWFNRRQLHWQGLHNLIDDAKVRKIAKKANK